MKPKLRVAAGKNAKYSKERLGRSLRRVWEIQAKPGGPLESERRSPKVSAGLSLPQQLGQLGYVRRIHRASVATCAGCR